MGVRGSLAREAAGVPVREGWEEVIVGQDEALAVVEGQQGDGVGRALQDGQLQRRRRSAALTLHTATLSSAVMHGSCHDPWHCAQ